MCVREHTPPPGPRGPRGVLVADPPPGGGRVATNEKKFFASGKKSDRPAGWETFFGRGPRGDQRLRLLTTNEQQRRKVTGWPWGKGGKMKKFCSRRRRAPKK